MCCKEIHRQWKESNGDCIKTIEKEASMNRKLATAGLGALALLMLQGADRGGCGEGLDNRAGEPGINVGGATGATWDMAYSNTIEVRVLRGGAIVASETFDRFVGGSFDLDGRTVDIEPLCSRDDVACPQEVFPPVVEMTQPGSELHLLRIDFNAEGPLEELEQKTLLGNVDSDDDFSIALGVDAAALGTCGLLKVSYATGHITASPNNPDLGVELEGDIVAAYSGGCVLIGEGGAAGAGLTVELRTPFSASRQLEE
jgi:hypothetical protein